LGLGADRAYDPKGIVPRGIALEARDRSFAAPAKDHPWRAMPHYGAVRAGARRRWHREILESHAAALDQ
jgi:hypothetical protein